MKNDFKYVAIIPARAGSKRLKNKNILDFHGKPLVYWTIKAAAESKYINKIVVSTDSIEIQRIANELGVYVENLRPKNISSDKAKTEEVLLYELESLSKFENFVLLQPTSPLRNSGNIDFACELFEKSNKLSLVSVVKLKYKPEWLFRKNENIIDNIIIENLKAGESLYALNGAIYIGNIKDFQENKKLIKAETVAYIMTKFRSIDIDTEEDLRLARLFLEMGHT